MNYFNTIKSKMNLESTEQKVLSILFLSYIMSFDPMRNPIPAVVVAEQGPTSGRGGGGGAAWHSGIRMAGEPLIFLRGKSTLRIL